MEKINQKRLHLKFSINPNSITALPDPNLPRRVVVNGGFYKLERDHLPNQSVISAEELIVGWIQDLQYLGQTQGKDRSLYVLIMKQWDQIQEIKAKEWLR